MSLTRLLRIGGLLLGLCLSVGLSSPAQARPPDLDGYPWLYLRDGQPLAAAETVVELVAVGDMMLGRGIPAKSNPLEGVASWLGAADLTLGNLEAVVVAGGTAQPGLYPELAQQPYRLQAPPSAVDHLQAVGVDLLGLANNHALDFGPVGLAETVRRLDSTGIISLGTGPTIEEAFQPVFWPVKQVRLAFLAFNLVPDPVGTPSETVWQPARWDQDRMLAAITAARAQAEAVIVSVHWGREYDLQADPAQVAAAQAMLQAGADLVIGHHPHVVQGPAVVDSGRLVLYSLGNFVFDQGFGQTNQGLALRAFFDRHGLRAVQALPIWTGPQPRLMQLDEAKPLLARIQPLPAHLGFSCDPDTCRPVAQVLSTGQSGRFWGGEIDLTGDGLPEKIRRIQEQVTIYRSGTVVWCSDPAWRVVDLALGDPNDDGRWEALLALWKPDDQGRWRSHPFIIGYRWGIYRDIWGGSAVEDPIHEVELGDVDGDGVQELIVLEEAGQNGQRAVSVWDWHGWGFKLRWRSASGPYENLTFLPATNKSPPLISVAVNRSI